jgi:hypothetical protein
MTKELVSVHKILFADFDGVLNHNDWWLTPGAPGISIYTEPAMVLNALAAEADEVCIISAWARWMYWHGLTPALFSELLLAFGLVLPADKLSHLGRLAERKDRAEAILEHVAKRQTEHTVVGYAVIDDTHLAPPLPDGRFFRIDTRIMLRPQDYRGIRKAMEAAV